MGQITVRTDDALVERVKQAAAEHGCSMNQFVEAILHAATDPDTEPEPRRRLRARLLHSGVLLDPSAWTISRVSAGQVAAARRSAAVGRPLPALVAEDRAE